MSARAPDRAPALALGLDVSVPGWVVRVGVPLLVLLCAAVRGGGALLWTSAAVVAALVAVRPALPTTAVLPALAAIWLLADDDLLARTTGDTVRLGLLVLGVHLVVRLGSVVEHVAWGSRVEVTVLRRAVVGILPAQLVVQSLLVLVALLRAGVGDVTVDTLRLLAIPAVVVLVLLAVPRQWLRR